MKRTLLSLLLALFGFLPLIVRPVHAQNETPPAGPLGEIRGAVINENTGAIVDEAMDVMLHVLDENYADVNMLHGRSAPDGTFIFADVPFTTDLLFAVMATFDGVTYASNPVPANMETLSVVVDVPVYETTKNLEQVQVDQMHVLFSLSPDGLETKELYILSNAGEQTVKDVFELGENKFATLKFPLPADADYIFFKPEDADRFVKQQDGFADTYAMLPGGQPTQIMVSYLVPFSGERTYNYTAPVNVAEINLVVPDDAGLLVRGMGLTGPESMTLQDGLAYKVYAYSNLPAGQSLNVVLSGNPLRPENAGNNRNNLLAFGAGFLGLAVIGAGAWWWRRSDGPEEDAPSSNELTLDDLITEIALLDETYEQRGLNEAEYQEQRRDLLLKAKSLSS